MQLHLILRATEQAIVRGNTMVSRVFQATSEQLWFGQMENGLHWLTSVFPRPCPQELHHLHFFGNSCRLSSETLLE